MAGSKEFYILEIRADYSTLNDYRKNVNMLEVQGLAVHSAKKLDGQWIVYEDGKLVKREYQKVPNDIKSLEAKLDVESNLSGLVVLDKIVTGKIAHNQNRPVPHIHFSNGNIDFIKAEKGKYVLGYNEEYHKLSKRMEQRLKEGKEYKSFTINKTVLKNIKKIKEGKT